MHTFLAEAKYKPHPFFLVNAEIIKLGQKIRVQNVSSRKKSCLKKWLRTQIPILQSRELPKTIIRFSPASELVLQKNIWTFKAMLHQKVPIQTWNGPTNCNSNAMYISWLQSVTFPTVSLLYKKGRVWSKRVTSNRSSMGI